MRVLVVEDEASKFDRIKALIDGELDEQSFELVRAETINGALVQMAGSHFDLVIVDLLLPQVKKEDEAIDATSQWCEMIENDLSGRAATWIVMTGYAELEEAARRSFARHDVAVIPYDESGVWEGNLTRKLRAAYETRPLDFIIVCALEKERQGFHYTAASLGDLIDTAGLNSQKVKLGKFRGVIVVQPNPGMISAAIVTTKALTTFRPRAVAMSGICGGREDETELGALIVPDLSWNYQSGKFKDGKLIPDLLQTRVPPKLFTILAHLCGEETSGTIREGLMHKELNKSPIAMAPMVSGSQVVADPAVGALIGDQGRKVAGIDMEVASVYSAAHDYFDGSGIFFAAKTVVDLADGSKDDRYHEYGCAVSARFVVAALAKLLAGAESSTTGSNLKE